MPKKKKIAFLKFVVFLDPFLTVSLKTEIQKWANRERPSLLCQECNCIDNWLNFTVPFPHRTMGCVASSRAASPGSSAGLWWQPWCGQSTRRWWPGWAWSLDWEGTEKRWNLSSCLVSAKGCFISLSRNKMKSILESQANMSPCHPVQVKNGWACLGPSESPKRRVTGDWGEGLAHPARLFESVSWESCQVAPLQPPLHHRAFSDLLLGQRMELRAALGGWGAPAGEAGIAEWEVTVTRLRWQWCQDEGEKLSLFNWLLNQPLRGSGERGTWLPGLYTNKMFWSWVVSTLSCSGIFLRLKFR